MSEAPIQALGPGGALAPTRPQELPGSRCVRHLWSKLAQKSTIRLGTNGSECLGTGVSVDIEGS